MHVGTCYVKESSIYLSSCSGIAEPFIIDITVLRVVFANFKGSYCQIYNFGCIFNLFCVDALLQSPCSSLVIYTSREKFTELCLTKRSRGSHDCFIYLMKTLKKFL